MDYKKLLIITLKEWNACESIWFHLSDQYHAKYGLTSEEAAELENIVDKLEAEDEAKRAQRKGELR